MRARQKSMKKNQPELFLKPWWNATHRAMKRVGE
jgi:hypothetical protein